MKKVASFLVDHRNVIFCIMIVLTAICVFLVPKTTSITNMQEYLPDNSSMGKGLRIVHRDFPTVMKNLGEVRVMFQDLTAKQRKQLKSELAEIKYIDTVTYKKDSKEYNKIYKNQTYTLYKLAMPYDPGTKEMNRVVEHIKNAYGEAPWKMTYSITNDTSGVIEYHHYHFGSCLAHGDFVYYVFFVAGTLTVSHYHWHGGDYQYGNQCVAA